MSPNLLDNPKLFRHLVEDLPVGIYIVDREMRVRFWNRGAEQLTGRLSHDVVGHILEEVVLACNRRGSSLTNETCPVVLTLGQQKPQQCSASYLHKNGHRVTVKIRTRPIVEFGDTMTGVAVMFEEAFAYRDQASVPVLYGCLDAATGVSARRLTLAFLRECLAGMEETRTGFGVLRVRVLGMEEFRCKHGPQSVVPFLRATARTLRHSLDTENFLGCWAENEFLAVLATANPVMVASTAESMWNLLHHSEVSWWGDRFLVKAEVSYAIATPGSDMQSLLREMQPSQSSRPAKAAAAAGDPASSRG